MLTDQKKIYSRLEYTGENLFLASKIPNIDIDFGRTHTLPEK